MKLLTVFLSMFLFVGSAPIKVIPPELYDAFTEGGKIKIYTWYMDGSYSSDTPITWEEEEINNIIEEVVKKKENYYLSTTTWLYTAIEKYLEHVNGKEVAIVGSVTPWYECTILRYGGHPTTIEYNTITCNDPRIKIYTVEEFNKNPIKFDSIISISSIEHDGLGRYGDPINPYGDYEAMQNFKQMLNPGGLLFLAVPVCRDSITFNAHRTYGKIRLPKLLDGWTILDSFGFSDKDFKRHPLKFFNHQPVFVLTPK